MTSLTSDWASTMKGSASIVFGYGQVGHHAEKHRLVFHPPENDKQTFFMFVQQWRESTWCSCAARRSSYIQKYHRNKMWSKISQRLNLNSSSKSRREGKQRERTIRLQGSRNFWTDSDMQRARRAKSHVWRPNRPSAERFVPLNTLWLIFICVTANRRQTEDQPHPIRFGGHTHTPTHTDDGMNVWNVVIQNKHRSKKKNLWVHV